MYGCLSNLRLGGTVRVRSFHSLYKGLAYLFRKLARLCSYLVSLATSHRLTIPPPYPKALRWGLRVGVLPGPETLVKVKGLNPNAIPPYTPSLSPSPN
jgi:hypothetical protein